MLKRVYYGELQCQAVLKSGRNKGKRCQNLAYWKTSDGLYLCGMHSKNKYRIQLDKNPNRQKIATSIYLMHKKSVESFAEKNRSEGKKGQVICSGLRMMKPIPNVEGFLSILPNYKHGNRKNQGSELSLPELSPKSMGPINHQMPGLPIAKNLENFHQGSKFYTHELDEICEIREDALDFRNAFWENEVPYRHKFTKKMLTKMAVPESVPKFSMYINNKGKQKRFTYLECRWFYCVWYQYFAFQSDAFKKLKKKQEEGYNLKIIGYDGRPIDKKFDGRPIDKKFDERPNDKKFDEDETSIESLKDVLYKMYLDTNKPFGHELVLYTLLMIPQENSTMYPWNMFYENNLKKYQGFYNPNKEYQ